ncbi:class I SAM-dependent methyltransferase [Marinihelvus fidelis]|uniref:Class I SAM-dependent methyltransferase n=1 Tax=Marinihelvus fidelis TaxID=2613842 RepID=A0A5N0TJA7_9GAMM|nr:cyclopropane-fatty-acyl-phospholipid synthase family protein [Marinihelvus fidelis]KAA9134197.1 class I SAM-dependent methyltransferase [Marinihelvus fidelis]
MKSVSLSSGRHLAGTPKPRMLERLARRAVRRQLQALEHGQLRLEEGDQRDTFGEPDVGPVTLTVNDPVFWSDIAFGGSIGAGEAYMAGGWDCDDLVGLVRLLLRNRHVLEGMESGGARLTAPLQRLFHRINRNSRQGARRNIAAHYDVGNDFFALWLDDTMMYSSAVFSRPDMTLGEAQIERLKLVCERLQLQPDDHLLEIGTGWGGLAIYAASEYGCRVTTTTISAEQHALATLRVAEAGLQDRITILQSDYRDLAGQYDKLVSIEMIEAIGWRQYDTYFRQCRDLLRPGGKALIQAITIAEARYEQAKHSVDFIQRYIFPGGALPSVSAMVSSVARQRHLDVVGLHDIGLHYAETLRHWRERFEAKLDAVRGLGYSETFIRMWRYYLCYCEGAFRERAISDVHLVFDKTG